MNASEFGIHDLRRILTEGSGVDDAVDLNDDILDTEFEALGYDSLAILETAGRVEREYSVSLDESALLDALTPRMFIDLVRSLDTTAA
ncbi:acyl carrier protein [Rhodococcus sp. C3V]|uniref:acyl carrier protein n=1 Tax=Rhodococcus TaxID=1827 RepID=UPI0023E23C93|nr:acyl carrier protein [Rhodococcus sp. C3V]MDF3319693.1 acyl carrier protein [Rhodococcus sp. C3V]